MIIVEMTIMKMIVVISDNDDNDVDNGDQWHCNDLWTCAHGINVEKLVVES